MNRRNALFFLASAASLGACARPSFRVDLLEARGPYLLAAGDRLRIIVFGQDNLSNIYAVDGAGRISMPLIGPVPVAGQTTVSVAGAIEGRLKGGYLREPKVTVEIDTYRPFFILGEVTNAGQYAYVNGMTVQTAIAIAGGFGPRADRDYAEITRAVGSQLVTGPVPLNCPVLPGDTVMIKERWF